MVKGDTDAADPVNADKLLKHFINRYRENKQNTALG